MALVVLTYGGSLSNGLVFDDLPALRDNPALRAGDWWRAAFGDDHTPLANRPLTCLAFALNLAASPSPASLRAVHLALHALNALLLAAVVRRTLRAPNLAGRFDEREAFLAGAAVACVWAVHPLGCDAVVYLTQRSTLLMATCLLGALLAVLRARSSPRPFRFELAAVAALALGMCAKEELAAAPLLIVLFERAFLYPSWRAMRGRWRFHALLAATWIVLVSCVLAGPRNPTVGYDTKPPVSAAEWLMTQAPVVCHYLRLSVWPHPLRGVYDWPIVRELGSALVPGTALLALLACSLWCWRRRPSLAWLGAWFFLLLAPTSSILPIVTEVAAERRMYLPMLGVIVPAVLAALWAIRRVRALRPSGWGAARFSITLACGALLASAVVATRAHARVYRDGASFWRAAFAASELESGSRGAALILANYGTVLLDEGRLEEAHALFARALESEAPTSVDRANYAGTLARKGLLPEAEAVLRSALEEEPVPALVLLNLASVLISRHQADPARTPQDPRLTEAEALARRGVERAPGEAGLWLVLGRALSLQGRSSEAEAPLRASLAVDPSSPLARALLGKALLDLGRPREAIVAWQPLLGLMPERAEPRVNLALAHLALEERAAAEALLLEALRIEPGHPRASALLEQLATAR